jgi:hypothetical protein
VEKPFVLFLEHVHNSLFCGLLQDTRPVGITL